jgi:hypothetical protein
MLGRYQPRPRVGRVFSGATLRNRTHAGLPIINDHDPLPEPKPSIPLRSALEIATTPASANWLLKPYVERMANILMVGAEGTFKSILALHWALTIAMSGELVIYLSAEGRGLWKRLRAWAIHHYPMQPWSQTLNDAAFLALERPINLSSADTIALLTDTIDRLGRKPVFVVNDTITRNSDGGVERSNEDAMMYLNGQDQQIRARYGASVLLIHHVGHGARDRARGPFSLIASTDANFLLERPDVTRPLVTVKAGRMKDCEPPPPFELEAHVVTLDELDEDGNPETSIVLRPTGNLPMSRPALTGKNQKSLLAELERLAALPGQVGIWTEGQLREIGRGLGMGKQSARDAVLSLRTLKYFTETVGGSRLSHFPASGQKGQNGAESQKSARDVGAERADTPLGVFPSARPLVLPDTYQSEGKP